MTTTNMRDHVIKAYGGGEAWRRKVLKMTDGQVLAIYRSLQKQGKVK